MDLTKAPRKLWEHHDPRSTAMWKFKTWIENQTGKNFPDFHSLYDYSVAPATRAEFFSLTFRYFPIVYSGDLPPVERTFNSNARMDDPYSHNWFPGVRLNFAENVLFHGDPATGSRSKHHKEDNKLAVTEVREGCDRSEIRRFTWGDLRSRTGRLAQAMKAHGVKKGDRVAVVASNSVDTLTVCTAVTSLGGIFSSSSTDMGTKGILDRLLQIRPRWVFVDEISVYNGKTTDLRPKMKEIIEGVKDLEEFEGIVSQPRFLDREPLDVSGVHKTVRLDEYLQSAKSDELVFEQVGFSDPWLIVYSSGTTGQPKCIVHSVGGIVLNGNKEGRLHRSVDETSKVLQYTTTGWIMYLTGPQSLIIGASVVLYDGSPFLPTLTTFLKLLGDEKVTSFGTSPRYLQELEKNKIIPKAVTDLSHLRIVTSTGMALSDALFEWFYDTAFPPSVHLDNISGGTDLAGAFGTGTPILPVYVGGCQGLCLGTPTTVYDATIEGGPGTKGVPVEHGVPGTLVADGPFPNMPIGFWGPDGKQRYFDSYFAKYDNVWVHGDFIVIHPLTRQVIFLGRADGVLNPSGVRFGSAEIYSVIDKYFSTQIEDSICVGQRRPQDPDESVMLFLLMRKPHTLTPSLISAMKQKIKTELSARHVPKYFFPTPEIPTTVNLKKVELPIKQIVCGNRVKASGTLLNPGSLEYYYQFARVEELVGGGGGMERAKL